MSSILSKIFVVETRTQKWTTHSNYVAFEVVYLASTQERAEHWMQSQHPGNDERYYYAVYTAPVDDDQDFEMIGYYTMLGDRTTAERCQEFLMFGKK